MLVESIGTAGKMELLRGVTWGKVEGRGKGERQTMQTGMWVVLNDNFVINSSLFISCSRITLLSTNRI